MWRCASCRLGSIGTGCDSPQEKKRQGLSKGRTVSKIEGIFGGGSMFKLPGAVSKHLK